MKFILLLILSTSLAFAQTRRNYEDEKELETHLRSNYIAEYMPSEKKNVNIAGDKRITLAYFTAMNPSEFGTLGDYEFQFAYGLGNYWFEALIGQGKADFGTVGTNSSQTQASDSEGFFQRDEDLQESYLYLGVGASLRSFHLADLFGFSRVFETFHGYLTYHTLSEELREEDYAGFGVRADASINYLLSPSSHFGVKLSYGLSALKRAQAYEGENSSQRSLMFRWVKAGLDYSFYF